MVNQALMAGTPVVAFEMGTAIDVIKNQGTGYCATYLDPKDFANGMLQQYRLTKKERAEVKIICRNFSLKNSSIPVFANTVETVFSKIVSNSPAQKSDEN